MMFVLACIGGIFGIAIITVVALVLVARKQGPAIVAARQELFAQTGFEEGASAAGGKLGDLATHYVKPNGTEFRSTATYEAGKRVHRMAWRMPLAQQPQVVFQLADRKLSSLGKDVKEALTGVKRTWSPMYPGPIELADKSLASRFVAFGPDPAAIEKCLAAPGLRELLLACTEVDLVVTQKEIRFDDPSDRNLSAARGGTTGRIQAGIAGSIRASIPVHKRMLEILARTQASL
ncbi:MAG: hypothetical protein ABI678_14065 [Kofleriaceae bacterium]